MIYSVAEAAVVLVLVYTFKNRTLNAVGVKDLSYFAAGLVLVAVSFGIVAGLIFGLIFGAVSGLIPGKRMLTKGLLFGIVLWLILHVGVDYLNYLRYGATFYFTDICLGLLTSVIYGTLLALFFERYQRSGSRGRSDS